MDRNKKLDILWFKKEDHRREWTATLYKNGKLHLGGPLRKALPSTITLGFEQKRRRVVIADGHGTGAIQPKSGVLEFRGLPAAITKLGYRLPVKFKFFFDNDYGFWFGIPRLDPQSADYMEQLLITYRCAIDNVVYQYAKTTPIEERRAFALEALCLAVNEYQPWHGDMEQYLSDCMKARLLLENKKFTAVYSHEHGSLDVPISTKEGNAVCRYDIISGSSSGGIDGIEEKIAMEQFMQTLSQQERMVLKMTSGGFTVEEIAAELGRTQSEVQTLASEIGRKRKAFYAAA